MDEPWYALSGLPADHRVLARYRVRFQSEETFRGFREFGCQEFGCQEFGCQEFGCRREATPLCEAEWVARLLFSVCLRHVWLMNAGVWLSRRGFRLRVDRHKKRQLSYFQIGWRFLQKLLACGQPLRCELDAYP